MRKNSLNRFMICFEFGCNWLGSSGNYMTNSLGQSFGLQAHEIHLNAVTDANLFSKEVAAEPTGFNRKPI